jgi:uncharacterized protein with FMN-binding domain
MTPTLRRAGGLLGMLAAAGAVVAVKGAGTAARHTAALPHVHHAVAARAHGLLASGITADQRGSVADTPYGPVQVELSIRAGRIVDVTALRLPDSMSYSRQVASYSAPILRQEVLTAQSANIDVVSGATYTSQGYAASVQAALDRLHVAA